MERRELNMAFTYAYSLDNGSGAPIANDFPLSGTAPLSGDCVVVASGQAGAKVSNTTVVASKVAVSTGPNFLGLQTSGINGATTASIYNPGALTKLILDPAAVYRIPWAASATGAVIGNTYLLSSNSTDQTLSLTAGGSTYVPFQLVDSNTTDVSSAAPYGYAYVTIQSANRVIQA